LTGTEEPLTDSAFISHLLMTLPASFDTFSDILLGLRTVNKLIAKVKETEDTIRTRQVDYRSTNTSSTIVNASALAARTNDRLTAFEVEEGNGFWEKEMVATYRAVGIVTRGGIGRRIASRRKLKKVEADGWEVEGRLIRKMTRWVVLMLEPHMLTLKS